MQLLQKACSKLLADEEFCTTDEVRSNIKIYNTYISGIDYSSVNSSAATFIRWHFETLRSIITDAQNDLIVDQEKLWTKFHEIRILPLFQSDWEKFLKVCKLKPDPLVYQRLSLECLVILLKQATPIQEANPTNITELTYEEANALRYMGGYIIRSLTSSLQKDDSMLVGLKLITNLDDDTVPAESEEWMCSIDRGGLVRITDEFYQSLCAIEYATHRNLRPDCTRIPKSLSAEIIEDSDVQFNWCIATVGMSEEISTLLIKKIVKQWITVRGFSFANSIVEKYKRENKKTTEKTKPLRRKLAEKNE